MQNKDKNAYNNLNHWIQQKI